MTRPLRWKEDDMPQHSGHDTPRRTVHVIDRSGWGTSGAYPAIRALTLIWTCPTCRGPRGIRRNTAFMRTVNGLPVTDGTTRAATLTCMCRS